MWESSKIVLTFESKFFFCQPLKLKKGIEYLTNSLEIYETYDQNKINKLEIEIYVF